MKASPSPQHSRAFSLVEMLAAVAIMGVIAFIAIPSVTRMRADSERNLAIARVEALNIATASFVQAYGRQAADSQWTSATTPAAKYLLIRHFLAYGEDTLVRFLPSGYNANYPSGQGASSLAKWTLSGPSGPIAY